MKSVSKKLAKSIGDVIGVGWDEIDLDEFHSGVQVELEHGSKFGEKTNVTKDDLIATGRIALAHLIELPDYYTKLKNMEERKLKEFVQKEIKRVFKEGDVVDLGSFRKEKRDKEDYYNIVMVSHDGKYVFDPSEFIVVELNHQNQADALAEGDIDKALELGASSLPITSTLFDKYKEWKDKI